MTANGGASCPGPSSRLCAVLHFGLAGAFLTGGLAIGRWCEEGSPWRLLLDPLLALGAVVLLLWFLRGHPTIARFSMRLCLVSLTVSMTLGVLEGLCRWAGVDFRLLDAQYRHLPPFYRKPLEAMPDGLLRRPGPLVWRGQVLRGGVRALGLPDAVYRDEVEVTVRYDREGFRSEGAQGDWEVAVAGDSFTELGHLPFEDLFTTQLGRLTGWRVRNLGVSHTGPLAQLSYLRHFGVGSATRHWVMVWYEGNDIEDLMRESVARDRFRRGRPLGPEFEKQSSLLRAVVNWLSEPPTAPKPRRAPAEAFWTGPEGEVALTLTDVPPGREALAGEAVEVLRRVLAEYTALARSHHVRPWLAYMPCKRSVLHGHLRFAPDAEARQIEAGPAGLAQPVASLCAEYGVGFVDLTPPLRAYVGTHRALPFNALFDTHLNAAGSGVVAQALARALTNPPAGPRAAPAP